MLLQDWMVTRATQAEEGDRGGRQSRDTMRDSAEVATAFELWGLGLLLTQMGQSRREADLGKMVKSLSSDMLNLVNTFL